LTIPAFAASGPFDLIVANILANPLIGLAPAMTTQLAARIGS
jgi:ribosomal protein L11 methyltransferase